MVQLAFNAQQYAPQYGGGGEQLPKGIYKVVIVNTHDEPVEKGGQRVGGYLAFDLSPIEGQYVGKKQIDRLNLWHQKPQVVEIANKQLSAYCYVTNKYQFNDTQELCNIPFQIEIDWQPGQEPTPEKPQGGFTQVIRLMDINGNEPGKAGAGPQTQAAPQAPPPGPPAGGVQPQGNGWGQPQAQPGPAPQGAPPAGQWSQQPAPEQPPQGQWGQGGQPQGGQPQGNWQPAPQAQPQAQPQPQGQPAPQGQWGQPQGGPPANGWGQR